MNQKSQRTFLGRAHAGASSTACHGPNPKRGDPKSGLKINSARQDIANGSSSQTQQTSTIHGGSQTTKNYQQHNISFKSKLQSKYGINAQNKMIATGKLKTQASGAKLHSVGKSLNQYQSMSLSNSKIPVTTCAWK